MNDYRMRALTCLTFAFLLRGSALDAQQSRWVFIGASARGDSSFIDTVGTVRGDGFVNAWTRMKLASDAPVQALPDVETAIGKLQDVRYVATMERYKIECRTRTFAIVQTLYVDTAGSSYKVPRFGPPRPPTMLAPVPDSWSELVVNYFCPKAKKPRP